MPRHPAPSDRSRPTTPRAAVRRRLHAAAAAAAATLTMLPARVALGADAPPEMLFEAVARLLGVPAVFNLVHALPWGLDRSAKLVLYAASLLAWIGVWTALGIPLLAWTRGRSRAVALPTLALAGGLATALLTALVLFPAQGLGIAGFADANVARPPLRAHLWSFAFGALFGALLALGSGARGAPERVGAGSGGHADGSVRTDASGSALERVAAPARPSPAAPGAPSGPARRRVLRVGVRLGGALALGAPSLRTLAVGLARAQEAVGGAHDAATAWLGRVAGLSPVITPTDEHYVVSKNVFDPRVAEGRWELRLTGLVEREVTLGLEEVRALPSVERPSTLTCVSNPVGGDLIGTSVWRGVPLADLLALAGPRPEAVELILRGADNYSDSFPLEAALREGAIVAYEQNGEPLTRAHGFPARVLVPGIYGMKNVKWVVEIELAAADHLGYWQTRGWSDVAVVRTMSRVDTPRATILEDGTAAVGGIAFAGLRGVRRVEVSTDGGISWSEATLAPAPNGLSWNLWGFRWRAEPGTYRVQVRATDGEGALQTAERTRPLPAGATGWHELVVQVG